MRGYDATLFDKSSCFAPTFSVTKFTIATDTIWITLCCAAKVRLRCLTNGLSRLAMFVSKTVGDSDTWLYLPWPPWVTQHR